MPYYSCGTYCNTRDEAKAHQEVCAILHHPTKK